MRVNQCGYASFGDISTAFASLHRRIALMCDTDVDEIWLSHLRRCGFSDDQAFSILRLACTLLQWIEHGVMNTCFC